MKKKLLTKFWLASCCIFLSSNLYSASINGFQYTLDDNSKTITSEGIIINNQVEVNGIVYNITTDNKAILREVIKSKRPEVTEVVIPDTIRVKYSLGKIMECQVTEIGESAFSEFAFKGCPKLTTITIPEGVTKIGYNAFEGCKALANITIPKSVTIIEGKAFSDTEWYKKNFPNDGLVYINSIAYGYKGEMLKDTTLSIKEGTVSIAGSAFSSCEKLTSISLPTSLKRIGKYAFNACEKLSEITLPEKLEYIEGGAFIDTPIKKITIPASVKYIGNTISFAKEIRFEGVTPPNNNSTRPPYEPEVTYYVPLKSFAAYYKANLIPFGTNYNNSLMVRTLEDNTIIYGVVSHQSGMNVGTITLNGEKESIIGVKAGDVVNIKAVAPESDYIINEFQVNDRKPIRLGSTSFSYSIKGASESYSIRVNFKYTASVSNEKIDTIRVYASEGTVKIENTNGTPPVTILNLAGQQVYQGTTDSYEGISLPAGMYIVKVGTETHKVVIK